MRHMVICRLRERKGRSEHHALPDADASDVLALSMYEAKWEPRLRPLKDW